MSRVYRYGRNNSYSLSNSQIIPAALRYEFLATFELTIRINENTIHDKKGQIKTTRKALDSILYGSNVGRCYGLGYGTSDISLEDMEPFADIVMEIYYDHGLLHDMINSGNMNSRHEQDMKRVLAFASKHEIPIDNILKGNIDYEASAMLRRETGLFPKHRNTCKSLLNMTGNNLPKYLGYAVDRHSRNGHVKGSRIEISTTHILTDIDLAVAMPMDDWNALVQELCDRGIVGISFARPEYNL